MPNFIKLGFLWIAAYCVLNLSPQAHAHYYTGTQDDVYVQSRLDEFTLNWLLGRTRGVLKNALGTDYFENTIPLKKDILFTYEELLSSYGYDALIKNLGSVFKVNLKNLALRIRIPKIYYNVQKLKLQPSRLSVLDPKFDLSTFAEASEISVGMPDNIYADLLILNDDQQTYSTIITATLDRPHIKIPTTLPAVPFQFNFQFYKRSTSIELSGNQYQLSHLPEYVRNYQKDFILTAGATGDPLGPQHFSIDPIKLKINQRDRELTLDSFKTVFASKLPWILESILNVVGDALETSIGPNILDGIFEQTLSNTITIKSGLFYTEYNISKLEQPENDQFRISIQGNHCIQELYEKYGKDCVQYEGVKQPVREITAEDYLKAKHEITQKLKSQEADIALSIGEEYFNRLLGTTTKTDLWNKYLEEENLSLGPKGAFMLFDQSHPDPILIVDLEYDDRVHLKFPLKISTQIAIISKQSKDDTTMTPYLTVRINKVLSTTQEIVKGIPAFDLKSKLLPVFKKKVAKMILKMASKLENTTVLELKLDTLRGAGVENMYYEISPYGRLNVYFKSGL